MRKASLHLSLSRHASAVVHRDGVFPGGSRFSFLHKPGALAQVISTIRLQLAKALRFYSHRAPRSQSLEETQILR